MGISGLWLVTIRKLIPLVKGQCDGEQFKFYHGVPFISAGEVPRSGLHSFLVPIRLLLLQHKSTAVQPRSVGVQAGFTLMVLEGEGGWCREELLGLERGLVSSPVSKSSCLTSSTEDEEVLSAQRWLT